MARRFRAGHRCRFESLENRCMLAGNVTASIDTHGNLIVKGDSSNKNIPIAVAQGAVTLTSADTTVNAASATGGVALMGTLAATGKANINLKGGTDSATLTGPITIG